METRSNKRKLTRKDGEKKEEEQHRPVEGIDEFVEETKSKGLEKEAPAEEKWEIRLKM